MKTSSIIIVILTAILGFQVVQSLADDPIKAAYNIAGTELKSTDNPVDFASANNNSGDWYGYKRDPFLACSRLLSVASRFRVSAGHPDREAMWQAAGFPRDSPIDKQLFEAFKSIELLSIPKY